MTFKRRGMLQTQILDQDPFPLDLTFFDVAPPSRCHYTHFPNIERPWNKIFSMDRHQYRLDQNSYFPSSFTRPQQPRLYQGHHVFYSTFSSLRLKRTSRIDHERWDETSALDIRSSRNT